MRTWIFVYLIFAAFVALPTSLLADDASDLRDRLRKASTDTSLDTPGMKPWHLVMNFELMDSKGHPKQTGMIEQFWAGPSLYKLVYVSGPLTWIEVVNQDGVYRSRGEQEPAELTTLLRREIVHPFPPGTPIADGIANLEQTKIGGVELDCIKLSRAPDVQTKPIPSGMNPIYCLDHGKTSLRVISLYNTENFTRMTIGAFAGKSVVVDQAISFSGTLAAKAHIVKLQSEPLTEADFVPDAALSKVADYPNEIAAQSVAGKWIKKVPPTYPFSAKQDHVSGTVLLHAIIGSDGHVLSLKPIYSPRFDLTDAAIAAVSQWIYEPYIVNGTARAVDTEITVNFSFGR